MDYNLTTAQRGTLHNAFFQGIANGVSVGPDGLFVMGKIMHDVNKKAEKDALLEHNYRV